MRFFFRMSDIIVNKNAYYSTHLAPVKWVPGASWARQRALKGRRYGLNGLRIHSVDLILLTDSLNDLNNL